MQRVTRLLERGQQRRANVGGRVVALAQMQAEHPLHAGRIEALEQLRRLVIVQVAEPRRDARLQRLRIRAALQRLEIVIALERERVALGRAAPPCAA